MFDSGQFSLPRTRKGFIGDYEELLEMVVTLLPVVDISVSIAKVLNKGSYLF